jgi:hypothetical protein
VGCIDELPRDSEKWLIVQVVRLTEKAMIYFEGQPFINPIQRNKWSAPAS